MSRKNVTTVWFLLLLIVLIISCGDNNQNPVVENSVVLSAPGAKVKLEVPFLPQKPPGDWERTKNCGQAAIVNCANYLNQKCYSSSQITEENKWLAKAYNDNRYLDPNGWITNTSQLANLARGFWGFRGSVATRSTIDGLYNELRCRPVVVGVRLRMATTATSTNGHFMVLVGMGSANVWVNDVGRSQEYGKDVVYPLSQFTQSWATQGNACVFVRF